MEPPATTSGILWEKVPVKRSTCAPSNDPDNEIKKLECVHQYLPAALVCQEDESLKIYTLNIS